MTEQRTLTIIVGCTILGLILGGIIGYGVAPKEKIVEVKKMTMNEKIALEIMVYDKTIDFDDEGVSLYTLYLPYGEYLVAVVEYEFLTGTVLRFEYARVGD